MHDLHFFVDQKLKSQKMAKIDCHIDIQSINETIDCLNYNNHQIKLVVNLLYDFDY